MGRVEIEPGSVAQVKRALSGRLVLIPDDVCGVARDLREIDPRLKIEAEDDLSLFVVFLQDGDNQQLVTTAQHLDKRIVDRIREIADSRYDYVAELEKQEDKADRLADDRRREWADNLGERLAHAFRKDFGRHEVPNTVKSRAAGFALKD